MKNIALILGVLAMLLGFTMAVSAQEKVPLEPLAKNASLAETQTWLVNALERNKKVTGQTNMIGVRYDVTSIQLSDCQLSFSRKVTHANSASPGSSINGFFYRDHDYDSGPYQEVMLPATASNGYLSPNLGSGYHDFNFNFKLNDPYLVKITLYPGSVAGLYMTIVTPGAPAPAKNAPVSSAEIFVKGKDAREITAGFAQLANLCSEGK